MPLQTEQAIKAVKKRQARERRYRYKYYCPVTHGWLWDAYCLMCAKAHINLVPLWISRDDSPNATYCFDGNIVLTRYDIKHLDRGSILALLAHEIGHDRQNTKAVDAIWTVSIQLLSFVFIIFPLFIIGLFEFRKSIGLQVLMCCVMVETQKGFTDYSRQKSELYADVWAARLAGVTNTVHLFEQMISYEQSEQTLILQTINDLYLTPLACGQCIIRYLRYRVMLFKRAVCLNGHPTYQRRIRHLLRWQEWRERRQHREVH